MSVEKKVKIRKAVGIDIRNGKWGTVILTFEEGTTNIIADEFHESVKNFKSGAIIESERFIEEAFLGDGLED